MSLPTNCLFNQTQSQLDAATSNASLPFNSTAQSFQSLCSDNNTSRVITTTDHRLYLYSRFDLLLLILNLTVILLPLGKLLVINAATRLTFVKCINKQWFNAWKLASSSSSRHHSSRSATTNPPSYSLKYQNNNTNNNNYINNTTTKQPSLSNNNKSSVKSAILNDSLSSGTTTVRETEPLTGNNNDATTQQTNNKSSASVRIVSSTTVANRTTRYRQRPPHSCRQNLADRVGEIGTQILYIVLFLLYLAYILELVILSTTTTSRARRKHSSSSFDIIPLELLTSSLTIVIHLIEYGIIYGEILWLQSPVVPRPIPSSSAVRRAQHSYNYSLHSLAFVFTAAQSIVTFAKLILTCLLFQDQPYLLLSLLKPYLLVGMLSVQLYFAGRHLLQLVTIQRRFELRRPDGSAKLNQVKYRRSQSTFLSQVTFTWFLDILTTGYRKNLELNDLGALPAEEQATSQFERFFKHYRFFNILEHKSTFLWIVCWRTYKKSLICGGIIKILSDLSSLIGPVSIGYILNYISKAQQPHSPTTDLDLSVLVESDSLTLQYISALEFFRNAYVMTLVVLVATLLQSTLSNNFNHLVISEGIHLKTALNCCIYNKALKMPVSNSEHIDMGIISNYMSTDSTNIFEFFTMMHYLWAVPIKIAILLYLLYKQMGISALMGAAIFFILSPFQYYCSRKISQIQRLQMDVSDQRLSKTTELFMGIKLLKLLGWDLNFAEHIKKYRATELEYLRKDAIYVAINTFLTQGSAILVTMITFNLYPIIEQKPLTSATVFTSIALFNQITTPLYIVPMVIPLLVRAIVSHRRLVNYLSIPELRTDIIQWEEAPIRLRDIAPGSAPILSATQHKSLDRSHSAMTSRPPPAPTSSIMSDLCCYTRGGKFAWYDEEPDTLHSSKLEATLSGISVHLPRGQLTIVVGSIGCGKSTFLASLLGETYLAEGELHWLSENQYGFGYVPSDPWILNVSLQENITFGRSYDRKRYEEVVKACCLQADIDLLPYGDQTVIGERGITLSGGQRQRIAVARALYSNNPTLILDDSLSALDPIVGYSVFDNAIVRLAIKVQKRTVILATHRHEFLSAANYVIVIESGTIKNQGTLAQIEKEDKAFFYQWNVIKERELHERLKQKPRTCTTIEERHKLVRLLSKKGEFRGSLRREPSMNRFKRKPKVLQRQMSYDVSNALPCHEWSESQDDCIIESELEEPASLTANIGGNALSRLISIESENSKQSYISLTSSNSATFADTNQNSVSSAQFTPSPSGKPQIMRLNSRISNYSVQANSIREEEEEEDAEELLLCCRHNTSRSECGCRPPQLISQSMDSQQMMGTTDDESEGETSDGHYSPVEDNTQEVNNELLYEIITFNENQVETATLYNVDINPQNNHISFGVYLAYLKAHSYSLATVVFGLIILNQAVKVVSDFWLAKWTDSSEKSSQHSQSTHLNSSEATSAFDAESLQHDNTVQQYIYTYTALSLISVLISLSTNVSAQLIAIRAVRLLHDNLLDTLVRCPLRFFDKTPIGRIMNRFTNDINVIDKKLPIAIPVLLRFFFLCLSAIIVNIIITPWFLLAIIPILVVYYYVQKVFRTTSRQLQRLELSSKAPIISHFNQTIDGLTTIRAFHEQSMFTEKFFQVLDINNLCFLMVNSSNCCLGIFLDYLGGIILFIATLISITAALYWDVQAAFVGLAMTYTLLVPVYLNWLVRNLSSVEMNMQSVERIYQYTQMDIEDSCLNTLKESDKCVPEDWPSSGSIQFQNVSIRYESNFEPIIKNASIHIKSGEKIGICGRTGSGKSSLISALFRINQICKGTITIDGQDITKVCPYKLRKRLSIIPQDLVLFSGTLRQNLDPGNHRTDEEIWTVLKDFHLDRSVTSLDEEINDDSSLSSGARQLLCCARAFLRHSPVLIMDESTSLLDPKSERLVLEQIFKSQKTIIAIAHRIMNIANFDKVLVVNDGRVAEFDTPDNLLRKPNSIFYSMYHKQGSR